MFFRDPALEAEIRALAKQRKQSPRQVLRALLVTGLGWAKNYQEMADRIDDEIGKQVYEGGTIPGLRHDNSPYDPATPMTLSYFHDPKQNTPEQEAKRLEEVERQIKAACDLSGRDVVADGLLPEDDGVQIPAGETWVCNGNEWKFDVVTRRLTPTVPKAYRQWPEPAKLDADFGTARRGAYSVFYGLKPDDLEGATLEIDGVTHVLGKRAV